MSMNMYTVAGDCPSNEELALRIQAGDKNAAELLLRSFREFVSYHVAYLYKQQGTQN